MTKVLSRLSIPPRLRDGMMLKVGHPNTFDVPNNRRGLEFLEFWKTAKSEMRDELMKVAYAEEIPIIDAQAKLDEEDSPYSLEDDDENKEDD